MKSKYHTILYLKGVIIFFILNLLILNCWGQISMTIGSSISQDFNSLSPSGGVWNDNSTLINWYWQDNNGSDNYFGDDGSSEPLNSTRYAYWKTGLGFPEIAMGGISTGSNGFVMGVQFLNNSGASIEDVKVSYTGEQWHVGGASIPSKITFWYKISTTPITDLTPNNNTGWTAVTALDFTSPIISGSSGMLDGNASANRTVFSNVSIPNLNISSGSYIMLRWHYPDQGTLHGLAIDDVNVSWVGNTVARNGNWNGKSTWNNGMPDANTNAVINGNVIVNAIATCYNLTLNSSKNLTINSGITLNVNKNFLIKSSSTGIGSYINNGTLNIIDGTPSVEIYVPGTTIHNGIYFTPPLNNILAPNVSDLVYRYNASTTTWTLVYGKLNVGTGYTIRSDNPNTIKLNGGSLNNSDLYIGGLVRQSSPNNYGWNLVGNPYTCGLDWEVLNNTTSNYTNLTNGFYIRTSNGSIVSYINGVGTPSGTSSVIPPTHAFYVQVVSGQTSGTLNIPLTTRTHNTQAFYKNIIPIIRLQLSSIDGTSDETVLRIGKNATDNLDNEFDGTKMFTDNDNTPQLFSLTADNDELCINGISIPNNKIVTIPLGFKSNIDGEYTLKAFDFVNVDKDISFFLKDNQTNTLQDLRKQPIYIFNTLKTFDNERFVIILSKQTSGINNNTNSSKIQISSINKSVLIDLQDETNATVEIYNVLGEQILNKQLNNSNLQKIDLSVVEGIYIVKVLTSSSNVTKKIIIK